MPPYRSTAVLPQWLVAMLGGAAVIAAASCVSSIVDVSLWSGAADDPSGASLGALVMADNRRASMGLIELAWLAATGTVFIIWFRRLYRNLPSLGVMPQQSHRLAVFGWVIPVGNLFVPLLMARELATSGPDAPKPTGLVHLWWAAWVTASVSGIVAGNLLSSAVFPQEIADASAVAVVNQVLIVVAAALAIRVVRTLDERQRLQVEQLQLVPA